MKPKFVVFHKVYFWYYVHFSVILGTNGGSYFRDLSFCWENRHVPRAASRRLRNTALIAASCLYVDAITACTRFAYAIRLEQPSRMKKLEPAACFCLLLARFILRPWRWRRYASETLGFLQTTVWHSPEDRTRHRNALSISDPAAACLSLRSST
jgi:hypothetical protein